MLWVNSFGLLLLGSLFCFTTLSIAVYMPELFATEYRARGAGLAFTCARIGIVVTPFPIVWAFDFAGLAAVTTMFSVFLVIALVALWIPRRRDARQAARGDCAGPRSRAGAAFRAYRTGGRITRCRQRPA